LLLAIEVISPDSEVIDRVNKRSEYAGAGVPRYWIVDRDKANTVEFHGLSQAGDYAPEREPMSLAWLLNQPVPQLG
jgi:Uma2 family endonuclease